MLTFMKRIPFLLAAVSLLASCAETSLIDTWRNPSIPAHRFQKLLVVAIAKSAESRRVYEDVLASELSQRGVEAVQGSNYISAVADRQTLEKTVKAAAAEGVVTIQTVRVDRQTAMQPGYMNTYPGYWYPPSFPSWNFYGYYGSYYEPAYTYTYDVATIEAHLFEAGSGKLIWAATFETSEPGRVLSVSKDLSSKIVHSLAKDGLI